MYNTPFMLLCPKLHRRALSPSARPLWCARCVRAPCSRTITRTTSKAHRLGAQQPQLTRHRRLQRRRPTGRLATRRHGGDRRERLLLDLHHCIARATSGLVPAAGLPE